MRAPRRAQLGEAGLERAVLGRELVLGDLDEHVAEVARQARADDRRGDRARRAVQREVGAGRAVRRPSAAGERDRLELRAEADAVGLVEERVRRAAVLAGEARRAPRSRRGGRCAARRSAGRPARPARSASSSSSISWRSARSVGSAVTCAASYLTGAARRPRAWRRAARRRRARRGRRRGRPGRDSRRSRPRREAQLLGHGAGDRLAGAVGEVRGRAPSRRPAAGAGTRRRRGGRPVSPSRTAPWSALGDGLERLVAAGVAELLVDLLEAVEVDRDDAEAAARGWRRFSISARSCSCSWRWLARPVSGSVAASSLRRSR